MHHAESPGATRRAALQLALGAGYAAATLPVCAQTAIATPATGLRVGCASYPVAGFDVPVYFALPEGRRDLPVVLVVQEIFGVHAYIEDVCRRFAQLGYLALAPELFARQGDPSRLDDVAAIQREIVARVPDQQVMADLDGALAWAPTLGGDPRRAAVNGFCWGGRIAWLYAARAPIRAGVAWYGRLASAQTPLAPLNPVDVAMRMRAPVLGLYGVDDTGIPIDTIGRMQGVLASGDAAARASEIVVFQGAGHAFHADYRPSYRAAAAVEGWRRATAWLRAHGVA